MTDTAYSATAIPAQEHSAAALSHNRPVPSQQRFPVPAPESVQDDDGQISCECGYVDDDGWTVACDSCNRWQHQLCYYPQYEEQPLPDDLQHYCVDCRPRPFDRQGAYARQKVKREEQASLVNGAKRPASKSHKKKVKEPAYTNGWPLEKGRHDRNSASPRDQPPPAKRPKTSHRTSDSTTSAPVKGHSRKRTASNVHHRRSLSRSPDTPVYLYSPEFVHRYRDDDWTETHTNLHNSIKITNSLSEWLTLPDDEFKVMHGHAKAEVLMRWDGELDDIPGKAEIEIQDVTDDRITTGPLAYPTWKRLIVKEPVAKGGYIGELKGHVGSKDDYVRDPSNRWSLLRHTLPFVFLHSRLPICIDARDEGTQLRYVRRSCAPNAQLQILVTDQTDYRFCFMALQQIEPGQEIAVGWDTPADLVHIGDQGANVDLGQLSIWVSNVLANCGPCACQQEPSDCAMARFDRRIVPSEEEAQQPVKAAKPKRRKGGRQNTSPLNTQVNSRSGSEARKVDPDDEPTDSRSASGSAGRGSASRDMTPNTHYSHTGSLSTMPELSERERKKLAKEEEMFRRQEEEQSGKHGKKKRSSGGSNLNTPATSSKQHTFPPPAKYADVGTSKSSGQSVGKGKRSKGSAPPPKVRKTITKIVPRPKPDYVDTAIQCDLETEMETPSPPPRRRPFLSTSQRLLQRCALNNSKRKLAAISDVGEPVADRMDVDLPLHSRAGEAASAIAQPKPDPEEDVEMKDSADAATQGQIHPPDASETANPDTKPPPGVPPSLPSDPPAPPWPSQVSHSTQNNTAAPDSDKPPGMHLVMPPPPSNPFAAGSSSALLSGGTPNLAQSPLGLAGANTGNTPLFSPSVSAAVTPSPARKKLSLSDYTRRSKAKDNKENEPNALTSSGLKTERESSPPTPVNVALLPETSSTASGEDAVAGGGDDDKVSAPALVAAAAASSSPPASDVDAKMEDVDSAGGGVVPPVAAAAASTST